MLTKYQLFTVKRYVEQFIMFPFIVLGNMIARLKPLREDYDVFLFFPGFGIGGAERVNAEIIKCLDDKKVIIFFTKYSSNDGMKHFFNLPHVTCKEIDRWTDNKWIYWGNLLYRGICSRYINAQKTKPVVFIGQCNFGYKLTPHLRRDIKIHELIHMYDPKFTWVWAPFVPFINTRIIVGEVFKQKFGDCYKRNGIPAHYLDRFHIIFYRLEYIPTIYHERRFDLPLKIYYAGRGGPQKRIWLIVEIIKQCALRKLPVTFKLAGSFKEELPEELIANGTYVGEIKGGEDMYQFHKDNDILLMTSAWEGFPLVIMEAMAFGAIPLVPSIDAIPEHITDGKNGYLVNDVFDEEKFINEILLKVEYICTNNITLQPISKSAFEYSQLQFNAEKFRERYRKVLLT